MAVQRNPGGRGTTQTGYGTHGDRRTKRGRTRQTVNDAAVNEWEDGTVDGMDDQDDPMTEEEYEATRRQYL
jgi:hypothetical protein